MTEEQHRKRLGRGLAALIGEIDSPVNEIKKVVPAEDKLAVELIRPNPRNPRRSFADSDLADLAQSIRSHGIMQPVVVRPTGTNEFELIAGERRWRAAQRAGLAEVPVIIRNVDDRVALELAIIENVQRSDLNPVEEASGYQRLMDDHGYTQADLAEIIGKSRSHVANTLRLLKLSSAIQDMLVDGLLSAGHARALVTAANPGELARRIVDQGLSVREAERLAQDPDPASEPRPKPAETAKDADTEALQKLLSDVTGMAVAIRHRERGGEVRIAYRTLEQLDELCRRLQG